MDNIESLEDEKSFYKVKLKIKTIVDNLTEEKEFNVFVNFSTIDDPIKISLINVANELDSYTAILSKLIYEELKNSQDLLIEYNDFPEQLKTLFSQCAQQKMIIKLRTGSTILLGFYTMSDVKELTVLTIPFELTSHEDMLNYLLQKNKKLENLTKIYLKRIQMLQDRVMSQSSQIEQFQEAYNQTYEEEQHLKNRFQQLETEYTQLKTLLDEANDSNKKLQKDFKICQKSNSDLSSTISGLLSDVDSLKIGIDYYIRKTSYLQSVLANKEKNTVPTEKYDNLNTMFCSAVADLLKCQVNFKQIMGEHEFQKTENYSLKKELTRCVDLIKNLETKLKTFQEKNFSPEPTSAKLDMLNEMIKQLEVQTATKK